MPSRIKPMPVGVENFKKLREKYHFVDKTGFIRDLIDNHSDITLITRPRRFGKTLAMSMLQYFFTIDNAKANRQLFAGLDIERAGDEYMQEQGTRPVISLSLKDAARREYADTLDMLVHLMQFVYEKHRYLLQSATLTSWQYEYYQKILSCRGNSGDLANSLKHLMLFLTQHWQKKPILLLDEYDAPIIAAWKHNYYPQCIDFMRTFLTVALKSNDYLDFAVLTGITRVSKESIFSGLNNLEVCGVLSPIYANAFGFTHDEVTDLMTACGFADKLPLLKDWYDGYIFGHTEIYNPWSVINFIRGNCEFKAYWINVSSNAILKDLLTNVTSTRHKELTDLLKGRTVKAPVMENIIYPELHTNRDALFMMLLTAGYLKAVSTHKDRRNRDWAELQIPNLEIKIAYEDDILRNIAPHQGMSLLDNMLKAMIGGNASGFANNLSLLLEDFVSYHDVGKNPENFYHGLMLGFSVLLEGEYRIESNRESGYGRFDLAFFPTNPSSAGIIIEIKTTKRIANLDNLAQTALKQIVDKAYAAALTRQGVTQIWQYGVAFCGKQVVIKSSQ